MSRLDATYIKDYFLPVKDLPVGHYERLNLENKI
jgi:hypothetical protein